VKFEIVLFALHYCKKRITSNRKIFNWRQRGGCDDDGQITITIS